MQEHDFEDLAKVEDAMWWFRGLHQTMADLVRTLSLSEGSRVLDAGCGTGGMLRCFSRHMPQLEYHGLDLVSQAVAFARDRTGLAIQEGSVNQMPWPDRFFDLVLSIDVLCQQGVSEASALREFFRCTVPGGWLLLHVPAYQWLYAYSDRHMHTARRYSASRLRHLLTQHGWHVRKTGYRNSLAFPFIVVRRKILPPPPGGSDVRLYHPWVEAMGRTIMTLESAFMRAGGRWPWGVSVFALAQRPFDHTPREETN